MFKAAAKLVAASLRQDTGSKFGVRQFVGVLIQIITVEGSSLLGNDPLEGKDWPVRGMIPR